jgi:hypothetical protein
VIDWTDDMLAALRAMRAAGNPLLICAERIGVAYPTAVYKARELGLAKRMNQGRRPARAVIAQAQGRG